MSLFDMSTVILSNTFKTTTPLVNDIVTTVMTVNKDYHYQ